MEEPSDVLVSADGKDAVVVLLMDKTGLAVAAELDCVAGSDASVYLVDEPIFVAVLSEPGANSAAVVKLVNEPGSFAVKRVVDAAVKPLDESYFAAAVTLVSEPNPAFGLGPGRDLVGEKQQDEEDLKCFERHTGQFEGS